MKLQIIEAYDIDVVVEKHKSSYCEHGKAYVLPEDATIMEHFGLKKQLERERRRYDNALKGLKYWKAKSELKNE